MFYRNMSRIYQKLVRFMFAKTPSTNASVSSSLVIHAIKWESLSINAHILLYKQVKCEVIIKKTTQDASDARYGVVFFGPHCKWLATTHSVNFSFSVVNISFKLFSFKKCCLQSNWCAFYPLHPTMLKSTLTLSLGQVSELDLGSQLFPPSPITTIISFIFTSVLSTFIVALHILYNLFRCTSNTSWLTFCWKHLVIFLIFHPQDTSLSLSSSWSSTNETQFSSSNP